MQSYTENQNLKNRAYNRICSTIPAFLLKTYEILENSMYNDIISWNMEGDAFIVKNIHDFQEQILPKFFKHSNIASFLNMYDFHKSRQDNNEFRHDSFKKGQKHLLSQIKRKSTEPQQNIKNHQDNISHIKKDQVQFLQEISYLRNKYDELEKYNKVLAQQNKQILSENKLLWNEILKIREKSDKKIEKLIFLLFTLSTTSNHPKSGYLDLNENNLVLPYPFQDQENDGNHDQLNKVQEYSLIDTAYAQQSVQQSDIQKFIQKLVRNLDYNNKFNRNLYYNNSDNESLIEKIFDSYIQTIINNTNNLNNGINTNFKNHLIKQLKNLKNPEKNQSILPRQLIQDSDFLENQKNNQNFYNYNQTSILSKRTPQRQLEANSHKKYKNQSDFVQSDIDFSPNDINNSQQQFNLILHKQNTQSKEDKQQYTTRQTDSENFPLIQQLRNEHSLVFPRSRSNSMNELEYDQLISPRNDYIYNNQEYQNNQINNIHQVEQSLNKSEVIQSQNVENFTENDKFNEEFYLFNSSDYYQ